MKPVVISIIIIISSSL